MAALFSGNWSSSSRRCSLSLSPLLLLLLLLTVVAIYSSPAAVDATEFSSALSLGANCRPIDKCRAGVANYDCCKEIGLAIEQGTCSCACRQLKAYAHPSLAAACSRSPACPKCSFCRCADHLDGPHTS